MHHRLVVQTEIVVLERLPDAAHPMHVLAHSLALLGRNVVHLDPIPALRFCSLACHVGLSYQFMTSESRGGDKRDSNTALKMEDVPLLGMTQATHLRKNLAGYGPCLGSRNLPHQNDKLVTAKPRNHVIASYRRPQLVCGEPQHVITGRMSTRIVDAFELV